jgi:hypothetical protein
MLEICKLRVTEEFASKLFAPNEGKRVAKTVREIELATDDPRFKTIGGIQNEIRAATGRSFFHGWILQRRYSKAELVAAGCFQLRVTTAFEPAGEECGTKYDESAACPHVFAPEMQVEVSGHRTTIPATTCGVGAKRVSDLFLDWKRIPKNKDVSRTIAGELVGSARLVKLFRQHGITGAEFQAIRHSPTSSAESKDWFELKTKPSEAEIVPPTRAGVDPFDDDAKGNYRCPLGHVVGLNLLSEVSVKSVTRGDPDIVCTRQFIGARRGLLRPESVILVSPKIWRLLETEKLNGYEVEVVHLV